MITCKIRFSKCCNPVPGDEIVGYITRGRGVSVHRADCPNIISDDTERFIEVEWDFDKKVSYQAEIQIKATDRAGLLADITQRITDANLAVISLNARTSRNKVVFINLLLEIKDIEELREVIKN